MMLWLVLRTNLYMVNLVRAWILLLGRLFPNPDDPPFPF